VLVAHALGSAALPALLFATMAHGSPVEALAGALVLAGLAGAVSAVGAVTTAELLAGEGRLTGLALGQTTATAVFGGLTPFLAHVLIEGTGWASAPGLMIAVVALAVLPVLLLMPETAPARRATDDA
jgi:MHS family proline/betaine transporter-like MFS transporter